jgi:hypothetical protein
LLEKTHPFRKWMDLSLINVSRRFLLSGHFKKNVPVWLLGTRFEARTCISEPGPQDFMGTFLLKHLVVFAIPFLISSQQYCFCVLYSLPGFTQSNAILMHLHVVWCNLILPSLRNNTPTNYGYFQQSNCIIQCST